MIGWNVSVYKQADGGASPATMESPTGTRLAVWQTGDGGLQWFHDLAQAGKAINLGGDGYPRGYTARAEHLIPRVIDDPPAARSPWHLDECDIVLDGWVGKTLTDPAAASLCSPDEWLLVEAWDES